MTEQSTPEPEQDFSRLWKVLGVSAAMILVPVIAVFCALSMNQYGVLIGLAFVILVIGGIVIVIAYRTSVEKSEPLHPILQLLESILKVLSYFAI